MPLPSLIRIVATLTLLALHIPSANGGSSRANDIFDADGDGLIEIEDLYDLNEIRNDLNGTSLYGLSGGCPQPAGCNGFELDDNLDFDTNNDGTINAGDDFWNATNGWDPIGSSSSNAFSAIFEGNGYTIRNLYINRESEFHIGLFGYASNSTVQNLGISGDLVYINGSAHVAGLVGRMDTSSILNSFVSGTITSTGMHVGGLVGGMDGSDVSNSYTLGSINGRRNVGGLIGSADYQSTITNSYSTASVTGTDDNAGGLVGHALREANIDKCFATGSVQAIGDNAGGLIGKAFTSGGTFSNNFATGTVSGNSNVGGLVGFSLADTIENSFSSGAVNGSSNTGGLIGSNTQSTVTNSYWATDSSGLDTSSGSAEEDGYLGDTLANLQCPMAPDARRCSLNHLYRNWESSNWDYGTVKQLPGLIINSIVYRDSDGDGILDSEEADDDADGVPNDSDDLPNDRTETTNTDGDQLGNNADPDDDNDGIPDVSDVYPINANEWLDTDNDYIGNNADTDDDNDGVLDDDDAFPLDATGSAPEDDVDSDDDGLIDIHTLADLDTIRDDLDGSSFSGVTAGCPQSICTGYELMADLDFNTQDDSAIDANDAYWNNGDGWVPIGSSSENFSAVFEGNGHVLFNFYIDTDSSSHVGLFAYTDGGASIRNLGFGGPLTSVTGSEYVGLLAGFVDSTDIDNVFGRGQVNGTHRVGGLAGHMENSSIDNCAAQVQVTGSTGSSYIAGIIGEVYSSTINHCVSAGAVTGYADTGGLTSYLQTSNITASYWDTEVSTQSTSAAGEGHTTNELQCPQSASDNSCSPLLYTDWDEALWDFGSSNDYPALIFNDATTRDTDNDSIRDDSDAFPDNAAASVDADSDGLPDEWNSTCDTACQNSSGLTLDTNAPAPSGSGSSGGGGLIPPLGLIPLFALLGWRQRQNKITS